MTTDTVRLTDLFGPDVRDLDFNEEIEIITPGLGEGDEGEIVPKIPAELLSSNITNFRPREVDIEISQKAAQEGLKLIEKLCEDDALGLDVGQSLEHQFIKTGNPETGSPGEVTKVFVANITEETNSLPHGKRFLSNVISELNNKIQEAGEDFVAKIITGVKKGTNSLLLAGQAKKVGVAKEAMAEVLAMTGLRPAWNGLKKTDNGAGKITIDDKLTEYGFRPSDLAFEALDQVKKEAQPDLIRVMLKQIVRDYVNVSKVASKVKADLQSRSEYRFLKEIMETYSVSEDSLYELLSNRSSSKIMDPEGVALKVLNKHREVMSGSVECLGRYSGAIKNLVHEAQHLGSPPPAEIQAIVKKQGASMRDLGLHLIDVSISKEELPRQESAQVVAFPGRTNSPGV